MTAHQSPTSSEPFNVVLIGLGMVARTHLRAIADLSDRLNLLGVYARNAEASANFAAEAADLLGKEQKVYSSIEEIAADADIDFVLLLTPPNARTEIIAPLAAAGKHILMEKPVERSPKAAAEIVALCRTADVLSGVVFQHRVREASQLLKQKIAADAFGPVRVAEVYVPWWRDQAYYDEPGRGTYARDGGGVLISQAIHTLDLLLSLVGDVSEVQAMARTSALHNMESEDFVTAGLEFANGAVGSLVASTASFPGDAESITLHFDRATTSLKSGILQVDWRDGRREVFGADASTGGGADPMAFTHEWHRDVIADFCSAIANNHTPLVSGQEALKVHHLIDALIQSSTKKQAVKVTV